MRSKKSKPITAPLGAAEPQRKRRPGEVYVAALRARLGKRADDLPLPSATLWETDQKTALQWEVWARTKAKEPPGPLSLAETQQLASYVDGMTPYVFDVLQGAATLLKPNHRNREQLIAKINKLRAVLLDKSPEAVHARILCGVHLLPEFQTGRDDLDSWIKPPQPSDYTEATPEQQQLLSPLLCAETNPRALISRVSKNKLLSLAVQDLAKLYEERTGHRAAAWWSGNAEGDNVESMFQEFVTAFLAALKVKQPSGQALSAAINRALLNSHSGLK